MNKKIGITIIIISSVVLLITSSILIRKIFVVNNSTKSKTGKSVTIVGDPNAAESHSVADEDTESQKNNTEDKVSKTETVFTIKINDDIDINTRRDVIEIGTLLWNYAYGAYWGEDRVWGKHTSIKEGNYFTTKTDVSKDEVLKRFTENATLIEYNDVIQQRDNFVHPSSGRGAKQDYFKTVLEIVNAENEKIEYKTTSYYCESFYGSCSDPSVINSSKTNDFVIVKEDGIWKIQNFYLPN